MKTLIIYSTRYGSTKKYAEWIKEELDCDILEAKKIKKSDLEKYDTIIYGGAVYMGKMLGIKLLDKNEDILKDKNLIVFSVGLSNVDYRYKNYRYFKVKGALNYNKLNFIHSIIVKVISKSLAKKTKNELKEDEKIFVNIYKAKLDLTYKESIYELVDYVKKI